MIPLDQVTVLGSSARVLAFPATARITRLGLKPGALHVEVDHTRSWPSVPTEPGDEPSQAATLWVFLNIDGRWHATGAERLRPGQIAGDDKPEDADVNNFIAVSWLFDPNRWGPMAGYVPKLGERVGMMVAAGSTRSDDTTPVEERTKVVEFAWPGSQGSADIHPVWTEGMAAGPEPTPEPPRPELLDTIITRLDAIDRKLEDLGQRADAHTASIREQITKAMKNLEASTASLIAKKGPTQ